MYQPTAASLPTTSERGSDATNVIPFPRRAVPPVTAAAPPAIAPIEVGPTCREIIDMLRKASSDLTDSFGAMRANAQALDQSCRALDQGTRGIASCTDELAAGMAMLRTSVRELREQLAALEPAQV